MRELIRKLQRVRNPSASSSRYVQLQRPLLVDHENEEGCSCAESKKRRCRLCGDVPEGYVPLYVGKESRRFIIKARLLNHPILAELLQRSAQEYGYEHKGGLKIPCDVMLFQHIIFLLNNDDPVAQNLHLRDLAEFRSSISC